MALRQPAYIVTPPTLRTHQQIQSRGRFGCGLKIEGRILYMPAQVGGEQKVGKMFEVESVATSLSHVTDTEKEPESGAPVASVRRTLLFTKARFS